MVVVVNMMEVLNCLMHMQLQVTMVKQLDVHQVELEELEEVVVITTVLQVVEVSIPMEEMLATEQEEFPF